MPETESGDQWEIGFAISGVSFEVADKIHDRLLDALCEFDPVAGQNTCGWMKPLEAEDA